MAGQLIRRGENTSCIRVFSGRDANGKRWRSAGRTTSPSKAKDA